MVLEGLGGEAETESLVLHRGGHDFLVVAQSLGGILKQIPVLADLGQDAVLVVPVDFGAFCRFGKKGPPGKEALYESGHFGVAGVVLQKFCKKHYLVSASARRA